MVALMKQYGKAVFICVTSVLVLGILFQMQSEGKTGFMEIIYQKTMEDMSKASPADYTDADAVKAVMARKKPQITYTYTKTLVGAVVNLENMFEAKDAEGNPAALEITDILNPMGESILYLTKEDKKQHRQSEDTKNILFARTGIYTVYVKAVDAEKKQTYEQYRLPVTSN